MRYCCGVVALLLLCVCSAPQPSAGPHMPGHLHASATTLAGMAGIPAGVAPEDWPLMQCPFVNPKPDADGMLS